MLDYVNGELEVKSGCIECVVQHVSWLVYVPVLDAPRWSIGDGEGQVSSPGSMDRERWCADEKASIEGPRSEDGPWAARIGYMEEQEYMDDQDGVQQSQPGLNQVKARHREHLVDRQAEDIEVEAA